MIKKVLNKIWNFSLKKGWDFIWSKTTVDEKAIELIKEARKRAEATAKELEDVKKELKEALKQTKDIIPAVKGSKRKGRPSNNKK